MPSFYPTTDTAFSLWLGNFITVANANLAALGLTAADITALQTLKTDLDTKLTAESAARAAVHAATTARRTSRANANTQVSFRGKAIGANPNIPNALKEQLGLRVRDTTPTATAPTAPTDLSVETLSGGINRLRWKRAGNSATTQFVIEARLGSAAAWAIVGVTTKTRFDHEGQTPGATVFYRVSARRGDVTSAPSNDAVAFAG